MGLVSPVMASYALLTPTLSVCWVTPCLKDRSPQHQKITRPLWLGNCLQCFSLMLLISPVTHSSTNNTEVSLFRFCFWRHMSSSLCSPWNPPLSVWVWNQALMFLCEMFVPGPWASRWTRWIGGFTPACSLLHRFLSLAQPTEEDPGFLFGTDLKITSLTWTDPPFRNFWLKSWKRAICECIQSKTRLTSLRLSNFIVGKA